MLRMVTPPTTGMMTRIPVIPVILLDSKLEMSKNDVGGNVLVFIIKEVRSWTTNVGEVGDSVVKYILLVAI